MAREDWASAAQHARRAQALLFWSHEPELVLGDAAAGLGDREATLSAYRDAVSTDPRNWVAWLRLAQVARGAERRGLREVHELNPLEEDLPGERRAPRLALAALAASERNASGDEYATDSDCAQKREAGVRQSVIGCSGRCGVSAGRCRDLHT